MAQGSLEGFVKDLETGEAIIFGTVSLLKDDVPVTGTDTDLNGYYSFNGVTPGTYDVEVTYVGYQPQRQTGVLVSGGRTVEINFEISAGIQLNVVEIIEYKVPLFEKDQTEGGRTVTRENIQQIATRNVNTIAATAGGVASIDGGELNIRGARSGATNYYVDGMRVSANLIPDSEIEQLQTITGGLSAKYGDVTGGVISITTRGPSSKFGASIEAETSKFLDDFERTLARFSLSGPILKKTINEREVPILGYRLSGQYINQEYPYRFFGNYIFDEETIDDLEATPLRFIERSVLPRAEQFGNAFLTRQTPNEENRNLTGTARIDLRIADGVNLAFTGAYQRSDFHFTTGDAVLPGGNWGRLNYENNPYGLNESIRTNVRLQHKIGGSGLDEEAGENTAFIRNVSYTLQAAFERNSTLRQSERHEDRIFDYGYVGEFTYDRIPSFDRTRRVQSGYDDDLLSYTAGNINPILANYNRAFEADIQDLDPVTFNGQTTASSVWSGFFSNVGNVYDNFSEVQNDRFTINLESSFDLFPGGSDKGRHNIEFGVIYEQRNESFFSVSPFELWLRGRQVVNAHYNGLDTTDILRQDITTFPGDTVPIYNRFITPDFDEDARFYKAFRESQGLPLDEYVHLDEYRPEDLDLSLFSLTDLRGLVGYAGYDHTGEKVGSEATFEGFFKDRDAQGQRTFIVPSFQPIYTGLYLQDKFSYKDLIFKLGVRVDRFDANAPVLRDPLSFYPLQSASDYFASIGESLPENVNPAAKVYTTSENGETVQAYRLDETWFRADGSQVNDARQIFGGQAIFPKKVDTNDDIRDPDYDLNKTFEDYEPEVNIMPRIAFSFPISEEANFFAHYDVTYQRPLARNQVSPLTYFFLNDASLGVNSPVSNANLRPEKTTDFEVGFQQKISQNSALRVSALYREFKDQIQARLYQFTDGFGPGTQYFGFDNIDVSTVKGLNFRYDLRRVKNIEMFMSYSLQFADGTGSSETSALGIAAGGDNITEIFPLSFDERHQVNLSLDYRYGYGAKYNGPTIGGKDIFANTGVNLLVQAISGRPFTKQRVAAEFSGAGFSGGFNEARYPMRFNVDLQVNKTFRLNANAKEGKKPLNMNVYFRALNVLNTQNIIGWYRASLSDTDDGYLMTERGQSVFNNVVQDEFRDEDIYLQARQWGLLNNGFYALPRRMLIGGYISF